MYPVYELSENKILERAGLTPTGVQEPNAVFELIGEDDFISNSINDEIKAIEDWNAELVIYDGRWTGNISAQVKKISSVSLI
ncbi:hypothetical protein MASR2M29_02870 [Spirochaetota bacterium]